MIRDADMDVKSRNFDWKFMWATATDTSVLDAGTLTTLQKPADVGSYDLTSFWLDRSTANMMHLDFVEWEHYRDVLTVGPQTSAFPHNFTIRPDNNILLWPQADAATYELTYEYWKKAVAMTSDTEISDIPVEFHRIIPVRAKLYYGEAEDAPEIVAGAAAEHDDLYEGLSARWGPDQEGSRLFRGNQQEQRVFAG
jgi:hypothetical protein